MSKYKNKFMLCVLLVLSQTVRAQSLFECASSVISLQGDALYVHSSLPLKPAGDPKRVWSRLGITGPCQALGVTEVLMQLQDSKIMGLHIVFMPGADKLLHILEPSVQLAISAQLARDSDSAAQHPLSIFKGDRAGFNYKVAYQKKIYLETISWGITTWGASYER